MFTQATSKDLPSVIFLQELGSGHMPCVKQDGVTIGKSGLEVAHVSRLAQQDKAKDLQIPVTCGRFGWS